MPAVSVQRPHPFLLENLVFGYLTHNGFSDTAAVVARDVLAGTVEVSASDVEEVQRRQQVPLVVSPRLHEMPATHPCSSPHSAARICAGAELVAVLLSPVQSAARCFSIPSCELFCKSTVF